MKPPISRRQLQKEDTRRIIREAAYRLFAEEGYEQTTMRALAQKAGVGLGTIFKHFPDKPSLLVAAFQEDLGRVVQEAFRTRPKKGLGRQLLHLTEKIYDFYGNHPRFSRTLVKEGLFLEGGYGQILDTQLLTFLQDVAELIRQAVENGELSAETNPVEGALVFGSFYFSGLVMGLKQPVFDVRAQVKLVGTLLDGYLIRK
ncbi:MAG: TetR/AcrR family transcriptional regulator [Deltaproteobacteria bacterium]|nr:TetR/AcrR family transcriptional regulator [Deltaproteobacteria bacterium]